MFFVLGLLLIAISNLRAWRRLGRSPGSERFPRVSILLPARNEETNVEACVRSLLAQDYPDFEVLVLDDDSTDRTGSVLAAIATGDGRLRVLTGRPLPDGWFGKHWACHQLAQTASGELLLFTDADTRHHPSALRDAVAALQTERADLLTALPRQHVVSWAEWLIVPIIPFSLFAFVPLALAHRWPWPALVVAVGQFMLFRRDAYERIGGYASVSQNAVDDIALARRIVSHGLRWRMVDGGDRIHCRMYHNGRQAVEGLRKNLFATFDFNVPAYVFVWTWLFVVFVAWPALLAIGLLGASLPDFVMGDAIIAVTGSIVLWSIVSWRFHLPRRLALIYPLSLLIAVGIAARSMWLTLLGRATWKGRTLAQHDTTVAETPVHSDGTVSP